jgi:hypothetical protein
LTAEGRWERPETERTGTQLARRASTERSGFARPVGARPSRTSALAAPLRQEARFKRDLGVLGRMAAPETGAKWAPISGWFQTPRQPGQRLRTGCTLVGPLFLVRDHCLEQVRDRTQDNRDYYGRLLRYVEFRGRDLGRKQLRKGWAEVYVFDARFNRLRSYRRAARKVRGADRGIWGSC